MAPDQDKLYNVRADVKQWIAWRSIIDDKDDLNLDSAQLREANNRFDGSNSSVNNGLMEAYCWLLVPYINQYEDIRSIQWEISNLGGGDDSIVTRVTRKMLQGEQIITNWAPALLKMSLDELLWKDADHITIKKIWEYLCTYCYLPRLANFSVLKDTIVRGANSTEFFGIAASWDGEHYVDLRLNEPISSVNPSDLLVKSSVAIRQIMEQNSSSGKASPDTGTKDDGQKARTGNTGSTGGAGSGLSGGVDSQQRKGGITEDQGPKNTHFFMATKLDNTRVNKNVNDIVTEIIKHLMDVDGANVEMTLEVSVNAPKGVPDSTVRTVSENCRTLRIQDFGFDD